MKLKKIKAGLLILVVGAFTVSCEPENVEGNLEERSMDLEDSQLLFENNGRFDLKALDLKLLNADSHLSLTSENLRDYLISKNAIEPSDCAPTELATVQQNYLIPLGQELVPYFGVETANIILNNYMVFNQYIAIFDKTDQYFGEEGESTKLVKKTERDLQKFWELPTEIQLNGQHTINLNNREKLLEVLTFFFGAQANVLVDQYLYFNSLFPSLPESPFFASDGFAAIYNSENYIVIGDGLVQMISEAGVEEDIVWTGILAHEWAHQIQFLKWEEWYPNEAADNLPESTRYTELEADFFAAYYMTHKRGATYNWKRVEQFFNLFFQIGDCSFAADGHHGTPAQRMDAARLGYELANGAHKQGHILTDEELHKIFVEQIQEVIPAPSIAK